MDDVSDNPEPSEASEVSEAVGQPTPVTSAPAPVVSDAPVEPAAAPQAKSLLVVIPSSNYADYLRHTLPRTRGLLGDIADLLLVTAEGSPESAVAGEFQAVQLIPEYSRKLALEAGVRAAESGGYSHCLLLDADIIITQACADAIRAAVTSEDLSKIYTAPRHHIPSYDAYLTFASDGNMTVLPVDTRAKGTHLRLFALKSPSWLKLSPRGVPEKDFDLNTVWPRAAREDLPPVAHIAHGSKGTNKPVRTSAPFAPLATPRTAVKPAAAPVTKVADVAQTPTDAPSAVSAPATNDRRGRDYRRLRRHNYLRNMSAIRTNPR